VADSKRNFVYGLHAINAVLERAPERLLELWVAQPRDDVRSRDLRERAQNAGVRVQSVGGEALAKLVGDVAHQGAVAAVRPLKAWDEHDLIEALSQLAEDPLLLVLDGVTDPHNLGAVMRSGLCAGATGVVIGRHRAARLTPSAVKAAAGAVEHLPIASVSGIPAALAALAEAGIWTVGLVPVAPTALWDLRVATEPLALVLGAEGSGLSKLALQRCDLAVTIPLHGPLDSLNVSAAAALACFEVARRRGSTASGQPMA
jgi:23S rRNA (guanosine2251-2'-O)-methyltransferase